MLLESPWTLIWGDLRAFTTIPEIRELSSPNSSYPEQATQVSVQPKANQVPSALLEILKDSNQDVGKGKEIETLKRKNKGQDKKKNSSNPTEKASNTAVSQPG